jgi:hypothetical protein
MDIWEIDKLILAIAFLIPGFISIKFYELFSPGEAKDSSKMVVDALAYSCINYALFSWAIYLVESNNLRFTHQVLYLCFYTGILFLSPVLLAYGWKRLRSTQLFQKTAPHPIGKPWDYVFGQRKWYWIVVTLKSGVKIAGKYGGASFASSTPNKEQIYLEETWMLNDDGGFERPREQTAGVIITSDEIASVELFNYFHQGEPS